MTDEEIAKERATVFANINFNEPDNYGSAKEIGYFSYYAGFLAGLKASKEYYSKIYMQGRKDEREHPCSLCKNPKSICIRCDCYKTLCVGSDVGVYVGECKDFIYKEMKEKTAEKEYRAFASKAISDSNASLCPSVDLGKAKR